MSQSTITLIIIACTCILYLTEKFSVAVPMAIEIGCNPMPLSPFHPEHTPHKSEHHDLHLPHIGMRKIKSIVAIFATFTAILIGLPIMFLSDALQTIIGVSIAWFINVKLLPYPPKPGTLSYWLEKKKSKKIMKGGADI